jgi:hypothetical protein
MGCPEEGGGMGRKQVLDGELTQEIVRLRSEVDEKGRKVWTLTAIAEELGVSVATVFRAAAGVAAYGGKKQVEAKKLPQLMTKAQREAQEEFARLRRMTEEAGLNDEGMDYQLELRERLTETGVML